ncbi:hypothetical protein GWK47_009436 [Chionoecetes opilio]|uniref:Uncharacterized protein n=1 Tax=Chionoecetes opilio TaxID=41210 RepID=A0A8J4Y5B8_CHIOP|nr:hypothetical protein GWK47_009436 [Chionoecetes opilio]
MATASRHLGLRKRQSKPSSCFFPIFLHGPRHPCGTSGHPHALAPPCVVRTWQGRGGHRLCDVGARGAPLREDPGPFLAACPRALDEVTSVVQGRAGPFSCWSRQAFGRSPGRGPPQRGHGQRDNFCGALGEGVPVDEGHARVRRCVGGQTAPLCACKPGWGFCRQTGALRTDEAPAHWRRGGGCCSPLEAVRAPGASSRSGFLLCCPFGLGTLSNAAGPKAAGGFLRCWSPLEE